MTMWTVTIDTLLSVQAHPSQILARHTYEHRTAKAALRRLGSVISGKLRRKHATAHRFYVLGPDGERYSYKALQERIRRDGIERV